MPSAVASSLSAGLTTFSDGVTTQLTTVVPIAIGVVVAVALLFFTIRIFRGIVHI